VFLLRFGSGSIVTSDGPDGGVVETSARAGASLDGDASLEQPGDGLECAAEGSRDLGYARSLGIPQDQGAADLSGQAVVRLDQADDGLVPLGAFGGRGLVGGQPLLQAT
jgi:hypothetical protein